MIYLYKSVNPKKTGNPKIVFKLAEELVARTFIYGTFGRGIHNDLWNTGIGNINGIVANLCPFNLAKWSDEE